MKRLIASALTLFVCLSICVAILYADPGDETPPQPDSSYVVLPPDVVFDTDVGDSCDTCDTQDPPWTNPDI